LKFPPLPQLAQILLARRRGFLSDIPAVVFDRLMDEGLNFAIDRLHKSKREKMKSAKDYLEEAHRAVPRITSEEGIARHGEVDVVFIDVRDSGDIAKTGSIAGALRVPRGFIEFVADDTTQFHNPALKKETHLILVCGAGGQAALTGRTLKEMGFVNVYNVGGIGDWKKAGGPMQD
jgi:rhodanese-related sulfurtransferase